VDNSVATTFSYNTVDDIILHLLVRVDLFLVVVTVGVVAHGVFFGA